MKYDLVSHLERQRKFSLETYGPGVRTEGVIKHIRKELKEIEHTPFDLSEWIDVVILALDGACRAGFSPECIARALAFKQQENELRDWPDWRTVKDGEAIEHIRKDQEPRLPCFPRGSFL
jgi:hypothetical protein